jgi:hypothetical protein
MHAIVKGLEWDTKPWKIVRTDLDLAHVFAPDDEITFTRNGDEYTVRHTSTEPGSNSLDGVVLTAVDGEQPAFDAISSDYPLPLFSKHHKHRYRTISERIEVFAQKNTALRRLEGKIKILCHDFRYQEQEGGADRHPSKIIEPTIHVYQFANAVADGELRKRLLVIYQPFQPSCTNGNGTALGYD